MTFGSSVKIGKIQRRLAWPLCKDDTHNSRRSITFFFVYASFSETVKVSIAEDSAVRYLV